MSTKTRSIETDVVIIGSGPTGSASAWKLAQGGRSVTVIERGDWFDYKNLGRESPNWELRRSLELNPNPNVRRGRDDYPVDDEDSPIKPMVGNAVGGSSIFWSAHVPRFRPEDFRMRSLDGVGDDWPISYEDLAPYYAMNEAMLGVAQVPGDPSVPLQALPRKRVPTIGAHGRRFAAAFDRLGWHWWPFDLVVGREADDVSTIHCSHMGPCEVGCPSRIRSGADHSYLRDAVAGGVTVLTRTRVARLEHDASGRVTRAVCHTDEGILDVYGKQFIVAANGMGTPRLLLMSASSRYPRGLGNSSGLVGKNLMLHPYARIDGVFQEPVGAWASGEKVSIISLEYYSTRKERGFVRGLKLAVSGGPPPVALARGAVTEARLPWGAGHHASFESSFDHSCGIIVCAEDLPEESNRVTLSPSLCDSDGLPAPKWSYRVSGNSRRILDFGLDRGEEVLREAGSTATYRTPLRSQAGFHIMGTARMGVDSGRSVVDPFGRCHDVENLFLADASVFVTSAAVNPTATAQALALRQAAHILGEA